MQTTIKPICASGALLYLSNTVKSGHTVSVCGPGYTCEITGYFLVASKSNGFHMMPYRSVTPSAAFTVNGSGGRQPYWYNFSRLGVAASIINCPLLSRKTVRGGVLIVE